MLVSRAVKLILQTQLLPDGDQARKLSATMRAFNAAADWLAGEAFRLKTANKGIAHFAESKLINAMTLFKFGVWKTKSPIFPTPNDPLLGSRFSGNEQGLNGIAHSVRLTPHFEPVHTEM